MIVVGKFQNPSNFIARHILKRPWYGHLLAISFVGLAFALVSAIWPRFFSYLDESSTSLVWRASDQSQLERRVVLVDIDEQSLREMGPWPWPRDRMAALLAALDRYGVGLKLFDVVFVDQKEQTEKLAKAFQSAKNSPSISAQIFSLDPNISVKSGMLSGALSWPVCPPFAEQARGYLANAVDLGPSGHITPRIDPDGAVRRVPALICDQGKAYPTLVLAGLNALADPEGGLRYQRAQTLLDAPWTLTLPALPAIRIPLSDAGDMRVSYRLPREAFISVSAADLMENRIPQELVRGAWAIVGATAFGVGDAVPTPHGGAVSGLEVHAQLMAAILDDRLPFTPVAAPFLIWAFISAVIALLFILAWQPENQFSKKRVLLLPLVGLVLASIAFFAHAGLLLKLHWFIGWASAAFFAIFCSISMAILGHARSRFESNQVFRQLASHLPKDVAQEIALSEATDQVVAARKDVSVLYADLRNFSAFSELAPSEQSTRVLHQFFRTASEVVQLHGGVIEHMVGDSVLAVWNGPLPCTDHPQKALQAALQLWERCSHQLANEELLEGLEPLDIGIGLESGDALVGFFGPAERRTHTVLGEVVTVAVQLQTLTADLACPILAGQTLAGRTSARWVAMGSFLLSGLTKGKRVFSVQVLTQRQQQERLKLLNIDRSAAA